MGAFRRDTITGMACDITIELRVDLGELALRFNAAKPTNTSPISPASRGLSPTNRVATKAAAK